jgi:sugar transferase (PEP-CTERM/EpsH1 system associated)
MIRTLARHVDLEVVALAHDADEADQISRVRNLGAHATALRLSRWRNYPAAALGLPGSKPLTHLLLDAPDMKACLERIVSERRPDIVFAYCTGVARFAVELPLAGIPLVIDFVDVDSGKWTEMAARSTVPKRWIYQREARHLAHFEARVAHIARTSLVVNDRERDALLRLAPDADVRVVENGVDLEGLRPKSETKRDSTPAVLFCGVMNYAPNVDGVVWFAREVWPCIRQARPDARFVIVGSHPGSVVSELAGTCPGVEVTGAVDDVRPYLWKGAVSVAPLTTARGVQNKVLEALAAELPVVVTPQVFEGLPEVAKPGCRLAESAEEFSRQTLELLKMTDAERRCLAAHADLLSLSWEAQLAPLIGILESALD